MLSSYKYHVCPKDWPTSDWIGQYSFCSDGRTLQQPIIDGSMKAEAFLWVNGQIKLGTNAIIDTSLTADPAAEFLGPYDENGAGIEVVIICRTCFVPPAYVHLPLAKPLSPRVLCTLANYSRSYPGRRTGTIILTFDRLPLRSHYKVTDKIVAYHVHCLAPTSIGWSLGER
jgi:hypothetical protein